MTRPSRSMKANERHPIMVPSVGRRRRKHRSNRRAKRHKRTETK